MIAESAILLGPKFNVLIMISRLMITVTTMLYSTEGHNHSRTGAGFSIENTQPDKIYTTTVDISSSQGVLHH